MRILHTYSNFCGFTIIFPYTDNTISVLSVGSLSVTGHTLSAYVIDWYFNDIANGIEFTSGLGSDPAITYLHPFTGNAAIPVENGTWIPIIRYIVVDDKRYVGTHRPWETYCELPQITVLPFTCDNGGAGIYSHTLTYVNTLMNPENASRTIRFYLNTDGSTCQFAWIFTGYAISDRITISYCTSLDSIGTILEDYAIGNDLTCDLSLTPKRISNSTLRRITDLSGITYADGDYLKIEIAPGFLTGNLNTNWSLSMKCFTTADPFDCSSGFTTLMQQIDQSTIALSWNATLCRYEVHFHTLGIPSYPANKDLFNYFYYSQGWTGQGIDTNFGDGSIIFYFGNIETCHMAVGGNTSTCIDQTNSMVITKLGTTLTLTFANSNDYNSYKTSYNNLNNYNYWTDYVADGTNYKHYKYCYLTYRVANSCGDAYTSYNHYITRDSVWTFDDNNKIITINLVDDVNEYIDQPCSNVYEIISQAVRAANVFNASADFSRTTYVKFNSPIGALYIYYGLTIQTAFTYYELVQLMDFETNSICSFTTPWVDSGSGCSLQHKYYTAGMRFELTDMDDPLNNWRAYCIIDANGNLITVPANYVLVMEVVDGVQTYP